MKKVILAAIMLFTSTVVLSAQVHVISFRCNNIEPQGGGDDCSESIELSFRPELGPYVVKLIHREDAGFERQSQILISETFEVWGYIGWYPGLNDISVTNSTKRTTI